MSKKYTNPIGEFLPTVLASIEAGYKDDGHRIWEIWNEAVGVEVARRVQPIKFRNGKLTVAVDGSSWLGQIVFLVPQLIDAVNGRLGKTVVTGVRAVAAEVLPIEEPEPLQPVTREGPLSPEEEHEIDLAGSEIRDEELRAIVRKAREASLRRIKTPQGR